jgi:hypothetical protein
MAHNSFVTRRSGSKRTSTKSQKPEPPSTVMASYKPAAEKAQPQDAAPVVSKAMTVEEARERLRELLSSHPSTEANLAIKAVDFFLGAQRKVVNDEELTDRELAERDPYFRILEIKHLCDLVYPEAQVVMRKAHNHAATIYHGEVMRLLGPSNLHKPAACSLWCGYTLTGAECVPEGNNDPLKANRQGRMRNGARWHSKCEEAILAAIRAVSAPKPTSQATKKPLPVSPHPRVEPSESRPLVAHYVPPQTQEEARKAMDRYFPG